MDKLIYLDHAATTYIKEEVLEKMRPYLTSKYGNASSIYFLGRESKIAIEEARVKVAKALGCATNEIYFTSSGTEANNWFLKGVAFANRHKGNHIITSSIEHHSVLNTCKQLESNGFQITYLPVDKYGMISLYDLNKSISDNTIAISIMYANNEVGTIQPIKEIGNIARQRNIYFHSDAVQAVGSIPIDINNDKLDALSLSAHKFYGPKGVGVLYLKDGINVQPLMNGGTQEKGKRAGTENVANIVGLGSAIELCSNNNNTDKIKGLRDKLVSEILLKVPFSQLNGHKINRLPGNVNFSFKNISGKSLLLLLDSKWIAASSGSACSCGSLEVSHVLLSMGISNELAQGSIRFTLGEGNTEDDIEYLVSVLPTMIESLRNNS